MESEILNKIKKIIREYSKLKKCFSTPIANNMLLVKIATRLSSYKLFHSFVVLVYSKKHKDILDFLKKILIHFYLPILMISKNLMSKMEKRFFHYGSKDMKMLQKLFKKQYKPKKNMPKDLAMNTFC